MSDDAKVDAWDADATSLYCDDENEAVHLMFGLTYSSYLVLPRVLLQSMPSDWQLQFCRLIERMEWAFEHVEKPSTYRVNPVDESGKFTRETLPPYNRGRTRVPAEKTR